MFHLLLRNQPLGAYVCRVKKAAVQNNGYGDQLCILFDISEGDFNGYYAADYNANQSQDKKWKGVLRVWIPTDDGSEKDELTKRTFKGLTTAFERSNPGYAWDWNEASLVGKTIGVLFRNEEWDYKGKTGWAVRPFRAISADSARNGDYTLPKDKPLKNKPSTDPFAGGLYNPTPVQDFSTFADEDDELPF